MGFLNELNGLLGDALEAVGNFFGANSLVKRFKKWSNGGVDPDEQAYQEAYAKARTILQNAYDIKLPDVPSSAALEKLQQKQADTRSYAHDMSRRSFNATKALRQELSNVERAVSDARDDYDERTKKYNDAVASKDKSIAMAHQQASNVLGSVKEASLGEVWEKLGT